jgi:hypothetical protein
MSRSKSLASKRGSSTAAAREHPTPAKHESIRFGFFFLSLNYIETPQLLQLLTLNVRINDQLGSSHLRLDSVANRGAIRKNDVDR